MALVFVGLPCSAFAEFPEKPITYIIPFNPGGESDITARLQEPHLEEILGVSVNVNHRPGGGGGVGWSSFQRSAKPTGYEIIGINIPHIVGQPMIRKDAGFTTDGFKYAMWFHFTPNALIVPKDSPFNSVDDLIAFAKKKPGAVVIGGSGTYSANHLETLRLAKLTGTQLTYIPHKGTGPLKPAILGGHLTAIMSYSMLSVELQSQAKVLAIAAETRHPALPDVPTFKEQGYDIVGGAFRGVAVPLGTPQPIVDKLADAFSKTNDIIKEKQEPLGFYLTDYKGDDAVKLVEEVSNNYMGILKEIAAKKK